MAYVDGELPPARAASIEAHLAECRSCQTTVNELRQVSRDLARWSIEAPPPRPAPRVRARARQWLNALTAFQPRAIAQFAAVGIVLVAGTIVWFESETRRTAPLSFAYSSDSTRAQVGEAPPARPVPPPPAPAVTFRTGQDDSTARLPLQPANVTPQSQVIRTARLTIATKNFDAVRPAIERVLQEAGGFVGHIQVSSGRGDARTLSATLRVPSARLDAILVTLRALGQPMDESQGGEDVTTQMVDLDARLKNSRNTEARLTEVLKNRTGDVGDVLQVEREIARVRGEIEQLDAQRKQLQDRVTYATITLTASEERQARLDTGTLTIGAQLRNALVEGMQTVYESAVGALLTVLRLAPVLTFWVVVLWWPIRRGLRAIRTAAPAETAR